MQGAKVHVLASSAHSIVRQTLEQRLTTQGVTLVDAQAKAEWVIQLGATTVNRAQTSLTGSGDVGSELITMTQPFQARQVTPDTLLLDTQVRVLRERRMAPGGLAAADRAWQSLQRQMAHTLVDRLYARVQRSLDHPQSAPQKGEPQP